MKVLGQVHRWVIGLFLAYCFVQFLITLAGLIGAFIAWLIARLTALL